MRLLSSFTAIAILCLALPGCGGGESPPVKVPPNPNEQWTMVAPAEKGMDGAKLDLVVSKLPADHGLASMIVLRNGKPVFEQYWNGYDKDTLHDLRSATKSITSLMVGVAIDKGMLGSVDEPMATHLSAAYPNAPALKHGITLANLLTMRSGLACNDFNASSPGQEDTMYQSPDWVRYFLNLPRNVAPGTDTYYCTGGVVALGRIIAEAAKRPVPEFAATHLLTPIGIRDVRWAKFDGGRQTDTGGHLHMRPRDMAKLGQLVLRKGAWDGNQLVPAAWIEQATSQHTKIGQTPYGYLWWRGALPFQGRNVIVHYADGNGGQFIFVIPELDLVVVFTGENYNSPKAQLGAQILAHDILSSIK